MTCLALCLEQFPSIHFSLTIFPTYRWLVDWLHTVWLVTPWQDVSYPYGYFPSGPGSARCHPSHPPQPASVNAMAEMEGPELLR